MLDKRVMASSVKMSMGIAIALCPKWPRVCRNARKYGVSKYVSLSITKSHYNEVNGNVREIYEMTRRIKRHNEASKARNPFIYKFLISVCRPSPSRSSIMLDRA